MSNNQPPPKLQPFDPSAPFAAAVSRNLPHWFQPGAATFITFRTNDSLPREVIFRWRRELEDWLRDRKLPIELATPVTERPPPGHEEELARLDPAVKREFQRLKSRLFHRSLDECHGACLLRCRHCSALVADSILHGEGVTHDINCLVVMPNHVHVLAQFREGTNRSLIGHRWMRYSARQINRTLGRRGPFWQPEPFDHLVRNAESFEGYRNYIKNNPVEAGLDPHDCFFWSRDRK